MSLALLWWAGNILAVALLVAMLIEWARVREGVGRRAVLGGAAAAGAALVALVLLAQHSVPLAWITVLQEGRTLRNVQQLYGMTTHHGPGFGAIIDVLSGHGVTTLPALASFNLVLWAVNAVVFLFLAEAVLRVRWAALVLALTWAANLNTLHAAVSETPAMLWTTLCWAGALAVAALAEPRATPRLRWCALACLAVLAALATLVRRELLLVGGPAVAVGAFVAAGRGDRLHAAARWLGGVARALFAGPWWRLVLVVAGLVALERLPWPLHVRWVIAALQPFNPTFLDLPRALGVFLPLGMLVLIVLGIVHGLRHWVAFALVPLTVLVLARLYASAGHGVYFETFRYLAYVTPLAFLLALFGFRELGALAARWQWPWWWRRVALVALALTFTLWRPPGMLKELFGRGHALPGIGALPPALLRVSAPLLAWNVQTEVRYLLDLVRRHPDCVFLTRALRAESRFDDMPGAQWVAFGAALPTYRTLADAGQSPAAAAAALAPDAACVFVYRGLDCHLRDEHACPPRDAHAPVEERVFENLPYNDIREYGAHEPEIRLGIYRVE